VIRVVPCTVSAAKRWVKATHRHLPDLNGALFAAALEQDGALVGVACASSGPRVWNGTGRLVISRVAVADCKNGCSALYGALCRAGKALGYREAWTYTLPTEPGTSLRAAGFTDQGVTDGGEWNRPSRARPAAKHPEPKRRWRRVLDGTVQPTPADSAGVGVAP
jgi:hypothetical protein